MTRRPAAPPLAAVRGAAENAPAVLAQLLPGYVVVAATSDDACAEPLHPAEAAALGRVSAARRQAFAAGRACARRALAALGVPPAPLLPDAARVPRWPAGVVGSITHCAGYCAAAVCRDTDAVALGIDVEPAAPLDPAVVRAVCTPAERGRLARLGGLALWSRVVFSAKESVYKSYRPATRRGLEPHDVEIGLLPDAGVFVARLVNDALPALAGRRELRGRWACTPRHLFTALVVEAPPGAR